MEYFPIFIDLQNKNVLVIGEYRILEFKINKMIEAGARIKYLTDLLDEDLQKLYQSDRIQFIHDQYDESYLDDVWLVVCGSNDIGLKKKIARAAADKNIFCNFVDEAPISSFISPSVISKGDITIAVSTKGKSPAINKYLKNEILNKIGDEYIVLTEILGRIRQKVINNIPEQKTRSNLFDSIVQHPKVLELIKKNKRSEAEEMVIELVNEGIDQKKIAAK
jgi:precorrin-2 dehydrogenase/sirohydrochlorin ferrochelatase